MEKEHAFAELLGAFAGDGWISKSKSSFSLFITGNPKLEKEYYQRIKNLFQLKFNLKVVPREFSYWKTYGISISNQKVINEFQSVGMPSGEKSSRVNVPNLIKNNVVLHCDFIRGFFDTAGCISFQKSYNKNASRWQKKVRHKPTVSFTSISEELVDSLISMLNGLSFNFKKMFKKPSKIWEHNPFELRLEGKANVKRFFSVISPGNSKHLNRFNLWLRQGFY